MLLISVVFAFAAPALADGKCQFDESPLDYKVYSQGGGGVAVLDLYSPLSDFPILDDLLGKRCQVETVRFYYSVKSFDDVTIYSRFFEANLLLDPAGDYVYLSPRIFNGLRSGTKYYFKVALVDADGEVLYITDKKFVNEADNSLVAR